LTIEGGLAASCCKHDDERLDRDAKAIRDAVTPCRCAMTDLRLAHRALVLNELDRWLVLADPTNDPASAKERQH
jgi:hypothetical protein